jgi:hypothetical protein
MSGLRLSGIKNTFILQSAMQRGVRAPAATSPLNSHTPVAAGAETKGGSRKLNNNSLMAHFTRFAGATQKAVPDNR